LCFCVCTSDPIIFTTSGTANFPRDAFQRGHATLRHCNYYSWYDRHRVIFAVAVKFAFKWTTFVIRCVPSIVVVVIERRRKETLYKPSREIRDEDAKDYYFFFGNRKVKKSNQKRIDGRKIVLSFHKWFKRRIISGRKVDNFYRDLNFSHVSRRNCDRLMMIKDEVENTRTRFL